MNKHLFYSPPYDRPVALTKQNSAHCALHCFLFQSRVSSRFLSHLRSKLISFIYTPRSYRAVNTHRLGSKKCQLTPHRERIVISLEMQHKTHTPCEKNVEFLNVKDEDARSNALGFKIKKKHPVTAYVFVLVFSSLFQ